MEKRKKTTLIKTRNSEFERYKCDVKVLYAKYGSICKYIAQHENAEELEKQLIKWCAIWGKTLPVDFDIRTGTGIVVEYGTLIERG